MKAGEQGLTATQTTRYTIVPRTLVFLFSTNPDTGQEEVLLLKGAPTKRLWANQYNGIGGHVQADEDLLAAARREVVEETGIREATFTLRGLLNIAVAPQDTPPTGVIVFVYCGATATRTITASPEGQPVWVPMAEIASQPLVDDLYELLPLLVEGDGFVYGHYIPDAQGVMGFHFHVE